MTDLEAAARRIVELGEKATPGPWAIETCGEKGDGSEMIGVVFGPDDPDCERPLSGHLEPWDADGNEIDYYRDELVAECEHRNRNSHGDATFIAFARNHAPAIAADWLRLKEVEKAARVVMHRLHACSLIDGPDWGYNKQELYT